MLTIDVPYQRQTTGDACGAAALAMVYESFGLTRSQEEIRPRTALQGIGGRARAKTWLLCSDALNLGFAALILKARDPWRTLQACAEHDIRAIINHRLSNEMPVGHYSVLVAIDHEGVVLHDPRLGPERRLARNELLDLWCRRISDWEITGRVLLAVGKRSATPYVCPQCGSAVMRSISCPGCSRPVPLEPGRLMGCLSDTCTERAWEQVFCPHCDYTLSSVHGLPRGAS